MACAAARPLHRTQEHSGRQRTPLGAQAREEVIFAHDARHERVKGDGALDCKDRVGPRFVILIVLGAQLEGHHRRGEVEGVRELMVGRYGGKLEADDVIWDRALRALKDGEQVLAQGAEDLNPGGLLIRVVLGAAVERAHLQVAVELLTAAGFGCTDGEEVVFLHPIQHAPHLLGLREDLPPDERLDLLVGRLPLVPARGPVTLHNDFVKRLLPPFEIMLVAEGEPNTRVPTRAVDREMQSRAKLARNHVHIRRRQEGRRRRCDHSGKGDRFGSETPPSDLGRV